MTRAIQEVLRVENMIQTFIAGRAAFDAVADISLTLERGETLGLVGESGCGKTSTIRAITQLPPPTAGRVIFEGRDLGAMSNQELRAVRRKMPIIFQDPISAMNPRRSVRDVVAEGLVIAGEKKSTIAARVNEMLELVGLRPDDIVGRRPRQLSGGQGQRVAIARALVLRPQVLLCDEPVSALDVSVQSQILNLLEDMRRTFQLSTLFISHDLAVVHHVSDRIAVMYMGKIVEVGSASSVYKMPAHHYTRALLEAVPRPTPVESPPARRLAGEMPSPMFPPSGCRFRTRCAAATNTCATDEPQLESIRDGHFVACHHPLLAPKRPRSVAKARAGS